MAKKKKAAAAHRGTLSSTQSKSVAKRHEALRPKVLSKVQEAVKTATIISPNTGRSTAGRDALNATHAVIVAAGQSKRLAAETHIPKAVVREREEYDALVEQIRASNSDLSLYSPVADLVAEIKRVQELAASVIQRNKPFHVPVFTHVLTTGQRVYLNPTDDVKILQKLVGGYVKRIRVYVNRLHTTAWVNEEGRIRSLPINHEATRLMNGYPIYGDMVVEGRV